MSGMEIEGEDNPEMDRMAMIEVWLHIHVSQIKCLTDHLVDRLTRLEVCVNTRSFC